jgi:uroporphyrinogen-III synthase
MRVLVTRPGEDAQETGARLAALGHQPIIASLLRVYYRDQTKLDLRGVQGILLTSANGARALSLCTTRREIPVFAVGRQTAATARDLGFSDVRNADGDAAALARAVLGWAEPAKGTLVHVTGGQTEGRLAAELVSAGFQVSKRMLYDVAMAPSELLVRALKEERPDAALFFSSRSALAFCEFVAMQGLKDTTRDIIAVAISPATAESLKPLEFREIRVATAPNQDALLACLG